MEYRFAHRSQVVKRKCTYRWTIDGFSSVPAISGHPLCSRTFSFPRRHFNSWQVCLTKSPPEVHDSGLKDFTETVDFLQADSRRLGEILKTVKNEDLKKRLDKGVQKLEFAIRQLDVCEPDEDRPCDRSNVLEAVKDLSDGLKELMLDSATSAGDSRKVASAVRRLEMNAKKVQKLVKKLESEDEPESKQDDKSDAVKCLGFCLRRMDEPDDYDHATYSIEIESNGLTLICFQNKELSDSFLTAFSHLSETQMAERDWLASKKLTVVCRIEITTLASEMDDLDEDRLLSEDFEKLLASGEMSDLTLCAGGKEFKVHKAVLSAKQELEFLLEGSNPRQVLEIAADVLENLLIYLYSGKVHAGLGSDLYVSLYRVACKYHLGFLEKRCLELLKGELATSAGCEMCAGEKCD